MRVSITFACPAHQRGKRLLEKSWKSGATEQTPFSPQREPVQAAAPAKRLRAGAGRALEGADPQKRRRGVQGSTQLVVQSQGALKTPLCGNELCYFASQLISSCCSASFRLLSQSSLVG